MKSKLSLLTVALLLFSWSAIAIIPQNLTQQQIETICCESPFVDSNIGVFAVSLKGDTLVSVNSNKRLIPASNVKLFTTGIALKVLGKDYKYETSIAYSGEIVDGTLNGDVYIIGGGDPTTGANLTIAENVNSLFSKWKSFLTQAGIKRINGRIIGDPRYFDYSNAENLSWQTEDLGYFYGSGPRGLNFFENSQQFTITPAAQSGSKPNIEVRYPQTPWMTIINNANTGKAGIPNKIAFINTHIAPYGEFFGDFPLDRKRYTFEASNKFAPLTCAYCFYNYLNDSGLAVSSYADISFDGFIRENFQLSQKALPKDSLKIIGSSFSPSVSQIIIETNYESDNFLAETLFRTLGRKLSSTYSEDFGSKAVSQALQSYFGLDTKEICQIEDGSGLSRKNYISPAFFVKFLSIMAKDEELFPFYLKSLPMPGGKGTLEHKFGKYPLEFKERIRMKSGSMNGVQAYSGYILPSNPEDLESIIVFSIICNDLVVKSNRYMPSIDSIIEILTTQN